MGLFNEHSSTIKTDSSITQGIPGPQGIGYKLDANGNFDIENKKLTNVKNGDENNDVMNKSQIESYVSNKTIYLKNVNPGQVINNKAVIYSNTGSVHSNALYLKDRYGQETILHNEDQDDNQIRLYIPNLKNNDSFGGRLKSSIVITSISQTIEGKKIFHDIEVPSPTIDGHASNKAYVDNEISKLSDSSDNSNYVKKSGDMMTGKLLVPNVLYPIKGDLRQAISYESMREIFLSRRENRPILTNLDMNNHTIDNIKNAINKNQCINKGQFDNELELKADKSDLLQYLKTNGSYPMTGNIDMNNKRIIRLNQNPYYNHEAIPKKYYDDNLNYYFKIDGSKQMTGDIDMNNNKIINIKTPVIDSDGATKEYVDNEIKKSSINPINNKKNEFEYLMKDTNEWSSEYNVNIGDFINLDGIPHIYNKKVLNIIPKKDDGNYRFRLGIQVFPVEINKPYTLCVELYNKDFITWKKTETFVNGTGIWLRNHKTASFQHHFGENGDIYYTRSIITFNRTSSGGPCQIYYTVHFDNDGGDLNTYQELFKNQIYVLSYGVKGVLNDINQGVYDKHNSFIIEPDKMKMLVDLDMNNKKILNINNLSYNYIYGKITNDRDFVANNNMLIRLSNIHIYAISITNTAVSRGDNDHIDFTQRNALDVMKSFRFPSSQGMVWILINKYFTNLINIKLLKHRNLPFQLIYKVFY